MEPLNDDELNQLLLQWHAPRAPGTAVPIIGSSTSRWERFWRGSVRVPAPLAVVTIIVVACLGLLALYKPAPPVSRLSDFRPVKQVRMQIIRGDHHETN